MSIEKALIAQSQPRMIAAKARDLIRNEISKGCRPDISSFPVSLEPNFMPVWFSNSVKGLEPRNRMREIFTYGSVGGAPGNRCFYPENEIRYMLEKAQQMKQFESQGIHYIFQVDLFSRYIFGTHDIFTWSNFCRNKNPR